MTMHNKNPGAVKRPGEIDMPRKSNPLSRRQQAQERITWQAALAKTNPPAFLNPLALPDLWRLLELARLKVAPQQDGTWVRFKYVGRGYAVRFIAPGQITLMERHTDRVLIDAAPFEVTP
jgi:hypothetical protein